MRQQSQVCFLSWYAFENNRSRRVWKSSHSGSWNLTAETREIQTVLGLQKLPVTEKKSPEAGVEGKENVFFPFWTLTRWRPESSTFYNPRGGCLNFFSMVTVPREELDGSNFDNCIIFFQLGWFNHAIPQHVFFPKSPVEIDSFPLAEMFLDEFLEWHPSATFTWTVKDFAIKWWIVIESPKCPNNSG